MTIAKKEVNIRIRYKKQNGNIVSISDCPFCRYENVVTSDPDSPAFPDEPDVCEHFDELVYEDSEFPVAMLFREVHITESEGAGATPKSPESEDPVEKLEEIRKICLAMSPIESANFIEKIYNIAKFFHEKYCDYPCFTMNDVQEFLSTREDESFVLRDEGTSIITRAGVFGNISYDHFIDSVYAAIEKIAFVASSQGGVHIFLRGGW